MGCGLERDSLPVPTERILSLGASCRNSLCLKPINVRWPPPQHECPGVLLISDWFAVLTAPMTPIWCLQMVWQKRTHQLWHLSDIVCALAL